MIEKFLLLRAINNDMLADDYFRDYMVKHYDIDRMLNDYHKLGLELLKEYAINPTEKSE